MIKDIIATAFLMVLFSCGSTNQMHQQNKITHKPTDRLLMDKDGNQYTTKEFSDHYVWMTANLKLNIPGSHCYDDSDKNCEQYGRLYTWKAAEEGCKVLGKGWQLPTKDDWQRLAWFYGNTSNDSINRNKAYKSLIYAGNSQFDAVLGGGRSADGKYTRLDAHGFYWTSTEDDSSSAVFYNFAKGSQALYQQDSGEKTKAFSVRCVKNINSLK